MPNYYNYSTEALKNELKKLREKRRKSLTRASETDISEDIRHIVRILSNRGE